MRRLWARLRGRHLPVDCWCVSRQLRNVAAWDQDPFNR